MILYTVQGANWQRGGGKGGQPKLITRPSDTEESVKTGDQLRARRQAADAELARRRAAKRKGA